MDSGLEDKFLDDIDSRSFYYHHGSGLSCRDMERVATAQSAKSGSDSTSTSILSLPPELLIRIFEFLNDFSTILSLAWTSTRLYEIWKINVATISDVILPQEIPFLAQAQKLLDSTMTHIQGHHSRRRTFSETILRNKILFDNKALAAYNLANYNQFVEHKVSVDSSSVYVRAFYQAATLCNIPKTTSEPNGVADFQRQYLSSLNMLEFKQLKEVMWYYKKTNGVYRQYCVPFFYSRQHQQTILNHSTTTLGKITRLSKNLNRVPGVYKKIHSSGYPGSDDHVSWLRPESCRKSCAKASKLHMKEYLVLLNEMH